ncbi:MAG: ribose 5-phosphate isomerase A [Chloroflexi bacterium]|nr:MAG: ribose 5-phosphate isomerase A [Chloroflexota bacterium]
MELDTLPLKQQAAYRAVESIASGMVVGLGTGTTALWGVRRLAERLRSGQLHDIAGIPTSRQTEVAARQLGIPLTTLEQHPQVDLTIDGADEVDPHLNLIKGGGGALLREKIVAQTSRRLVIVVDESKLSPILGTRWPVPVEVVPFGWRTQVRYLEALGAQVQLRRLSDGASFQTDQGNLILDANFGPIADPAQLAEQLERRTGIVEHGLFLAMADEVIVGHREGIEIRQRQNEAD